MYKFLYKFDTVFINFLIKTDSCFKCILPFHFCFIVPFRDFQWLGYAISYPKHPHLHFKASYLSQLIKYKILFNLSKKNDNFFINIDHINVSRVPKWIEHRQLCLFGPLKLRLRKRPFSINDIILPYLWTLKARSLLSPSACVLLSCTWILRKD